MDNGARDDLDRDLFEVMRELRALAQAPVPASSQERVDREVEAAIGRLVREKEEQMMNQAALATIVPPRLFPNAPTPTPRREQRRVPALTWLATAALLVLTLGLSAAAVGFIGLGNIVIGPDRLDADRPTTLPALAAATPMATPQSSTEITLLQITLPAGALPHGDDLSTELAHVTVPSGDRTDWTPGDQPGETSIRVFHVVRGTLSLRATGDVQITRAGGVPEPVATGTEVTLDVGDTWIGPTATGFAAANPGKERTEVLFWVLTDAEHAKGQHFPVPGSWLFHTSLNKTDRQLGVNRLPGPATLRLRQVQLPGEGRLPAPPGALQLGLALPFNAMGTPVSSVTTSVGRLPTNGTLVNLGKHAATVHVLTLDPTEATSGTPTS